MPSAHSSTSSSGTSHRPSPPHIANMTSSSTMLRPGFPVPPEISLNLHRRELSSLLHSCRQNTPIAKEALRKYLLISGRTDETRNRAIRTLTSMSPEIAERRGIVEIVYLEHVNPDGFHPNLIDSLVPDASQMEASVKLWEPLGKALSLCVTNGERLLPRACELHIGQDSAATMFWSRSDHETGESPPLHPLQELVQSLRITTIAAYDTNDSRKWVRDVKSYTLGSLVNGLAKAMRTTLTRVDLTGVVPGNVCSVMDAPDSPVAGTDPNTDEESYPNLCFVFRITEGDMPAEQWAEQTQQLKEEFRGCSVHKCRENPPLIAIAPDLQGYPSQSVFGDDDDVDDGQGSYLTHSIEFSN